MLSRLSKHLDQAGILVVLVVLIVFFSLADSNFCRSENLINIVRQISMLGISAVGMTLINPLGVVPN